ncbi:MAG: HAD family hydrolase [Bacteroidota bacterium]|nr:HAD family hydrolase [Bacteroidota bacterium]
MENKALIFDYGATLDTNGIHWYYIFKQEHLRYNNFLSDEQLRDAYIYAEQTLSKKRLIQSSDNFLETLLIKVKLQYERLYDQGVILQTMFHINEVAENCYHIAKQNILRVKPLLQRLAEKYRLAIVSNFYGNLESVLRDYDIRQDFESVIESAVIGVSKPDKKLLLTCLERMNIKAENSTIVGDSYKKDIVPAKQLGASTIWIKGQSWKDNPTFTPLADVIITDIMELENILL